MTWAGLNLGRCETNAVRGGTGGAACHPSYHSCSNCSCFFLSAHPPIHLPTRTPYQPIPHGPHIHDANGGLLRAVPGGDG